MADEKDNRIVVFRKEMRIVMKENVKEKKITDKLIGVYDYTVILTYISLFISVIGMTQAMNGRLFQMYCHIYP